MKTKSIIVIVFALLSTVLASSRQTEYNKRMNELLLSLVKDPEFNALQKRQQFRVVLIIYDMMESHFMKSMFMNEIEDDDALGKRERKKGIMKNRNLERLSNEFTFSVVTQKLIQKYTTHTRASSHL